jgi:Ca-activated chloride channel family protein
MAGLSRTLARNFRRKWLRARSIAPLAALLLFPGRPALPQETQLRVSVNRVSLGVTATDAKGRFVEGLGREEFRVFDNGTEQPITDFLPVEEPAQVLLLIESGPAVLFFANGHVRAADQMLASLRPDDRVAIATYARQPDTIFGFTNDKSALRLALLRMNFVQGFAELNLFSSISTAIDGLAARPGKKTIVLLSTGLDTSPPPAWEALEPKLAVADVRIVAVSLAGEIRKPAKKRKLSEKEKHDRAELEAGFLAADERLRSLARATGGRAYFVETAAEFRSAYLEIAELLRHEYALAFEPAVFDGRIHELRVEVSRAGVAIEHRPAYLARRPPA